MPPARPPAGLRYLYLTAFSAGLVSLAVELAAASLVRPFFGTTNLVWAALIGLILLCLSAGYLLGGRWADRAPRHATLYTIVCAAGVAVGLVPHAARPLLALAARGAVGLNLLLLGASFAGVLLVLGVPVVLLGAVSPFVVRLALRDLATSGDTAGRIYALSTAGSVLGAFLPDLLLVPTIGTRLTFALLGVALLGVGLGGLWRARGRAPGQGLLLLPLLALAGWGAGLPIKEAAGAIYEAESSYNYIQVVEEGDCRFLLLNEGQGIHSVACGAGPETGGPWGYFLLGPLLNAPPHPPERVASMAVVGLAAGTVVEGFTAAYGPRPVDGIEIDPAVVAVGRRLFRMTAPHLNVLVGDGRRVLARSAERYSLVVVDAYRLPYIPPHLTTVEFFCMVREHLTEDGVLAINVGQTPGDPALVEAMAATLGEVFSSVHAVEVAPGYNVVVYATAQPTAAENLRANLPLAAGRPVLDAAGRDPAERLYTPGAGGAVYTDDRASIEWDTNLVLLRYLLRASRG